METCGTCKFYKMEKEFDDLSSTGHCCLLPPTVMATGQYHKESVLPRVNDDSFCSQWVVKIDDLVLIYKDE